MRVVKIHHAVAAVLTLLAAGCPGLLPNVVGMQESEARAALAHAGFPVGVVASQNSESVPAGRVISQDPPAGAPVAAGLVVDLVVSLGPAPVETAVPAVTGLDQPAAEAAIAAAGLALGELTESYSDAVAAGFIISQSLAAGAPAVVGDAVDLAVSLGPEPVVVPDVTGATLSDAESALMAAGLTLGTVTEEQSAEVGAGYVIRQQPLASAEAAPGTTVDLFVSLGPLPATVPNLKGLTLDQARSALLSAGLALGVVWDEYAASAPAGRVIDQEPSGGAEVLPGAAVNLTLSLGRQPVEVPEVTGLPLAQAEAAVEAALLSLGAVVEVYRPEMTPGEVVGQQPSAGTVVFAGNVIDLDVASREIVIYSIAELQRIGNDPAYPMDAPYALGRDIDASETASWNGGQGFKTIGWHEPDTYERFSGVLDGRGHCISDLTIKGRDLAALFLSIGRGGQVSNLELREVSLDEGETMAGIGLVNSGIVKNCTVSGYIGDNGFDAGGVVVQNRGLVDNCVFIGRIEAEDNCGGIAYWNQGLITSCQFSGDLKTRSNAGGITARNVFGKISGCSSEGIVKADHVAGGIVGYNGRPSNSSYKYPNVLHCRSSCTVAAEDVAGGIAGLNDGNICECSSSSPVYADGPGANVGGVVGCNEGAIDRCYATGFVWGRDNAGGLVGSNFNSVTDCFAAAFLYGLDDCGGLVGKNDGQIIRCYSTTRIDSPGEAGGLAGGGRGRVQSSFWCPETSGVAESAGGMSISVPLLLKPATFTRDGWNYGSQTEPIWRQIEGQTVPYLAWSTEPGVTYSLELTAINGAAQSVPAAEEYPAWALVKLEATPFPGMDYAGWNLIQPALPQTFDSNVIYFMMSGPVSAQAVFLPRPIEIYSLGQLQQIGQNVSHPLHWDYVLMNDIDASPTAGWNGGAGFASIGDKSKPFCGKFDGQLHAITSLVVNRPDEDYAGLFGVVESEGEVSRLFLQDIAVTGRRAGTVACINRGEINDCIVSGAVTGEKAGGLVYANGLKELWYTSYASGAIRRCRASVAVTGLPYDSSHVGGFCGYNISEIEQCVATGDVVGVQYVGGFVGLLQGLVADSYAAGSVTGYAAVGGFAGGGTGSCRNCYSIGGVDGMEGAGGFAGRNHFGYYDYGQISAEACYFDAGIALTLRSYGGISMTTPQMMSAATYKGWDFDDVWQIDEGNSYPWLKWESEPAN